MVSRGVQNVKFFDMKLALWFSPFYYTSGVTTKNFSHLAYVECPPLGVPIIFFKFYGLFNDSMYMGTLIWLHKIIMSSDFHMVGLNLKKNWLLAEINESHEKINYIRASWDKLGTLDQGILNCKNKVNTSLAAKEALANRRHGKSV